MGYEKRFPEIWKGVSPNGLSPREIRRYIQLACVLEPLSEKKGCTTRSKNVSRFQKLEYYLAGGVNIGDSFEDLAEQFIKRHDYPYYFAYLAQLDSKKNRKGGRTNQGIIEFLFPLVLTQLTYPHTADPCRIIYSAPMTLRDHTYRKDTIWLKKMQETAFAMSGMDERIEEIPKRDFENVYEYYSYRLNMSKKPSDFFHNREIVKGYPTLEKMLKEYNKNSSLSLSENLKLVYDSARKENKNAPPGILADLIACTIYLVLSCDKTAKIIT